MPRYRSFAVFGTVLVLLMVVPPIGVTTANSGETSVGVAQPEDDSTPHAVSHNTTGNESTEKASDGNAGEPSELPGITNVAAGSNLTIATGHGDDVRTVASPNDTDRGVEGSSKVAGTATGYGDKVSDEATSMEQGSYREGNEAPLEMERGVKIGDKLSVSGLIDEIQEDDRISIPDEEAEDISTVGEAIEYLEKNAKD